MSVKNKSKVAIWTRIKNIYNENSFNAAFSYPVSVVILTAVLFFLIAYLSNENDSLLIAGVLFTLASKKIFREFSCTID